MHSAYSEANESIFYSCIEFLLNITLSSKPSLHVWSFFPLQHTSSTSVICDTLRWPHCKERMWGVRENPSANSHQGSLWMWCGLPEGPEHRSDMCEGLRSSSLQREGKGCWQQLVCSCMLLLTQTLTVHPLTTPRSRQCVQMRPGLPWVHQGCVHTEGIGTEVHTTLPYLKKIWIIPMYDMTSCVDS